MAYSFEQEKEDFLKEINENRPNYETILQKYSIEIRSNKELVLLAINKTGLEFQYASDNIKKDKDFIISLDVRLPIVLNYISDELKNDRIFMLNTVYVYRYSFLAASKELQDDESFLYQVKEVFDYFNGDMFYLINQRIQNEISKNPDYLLNFAPVNLKPAKKNR